MRTPHLPACQERRPKRRLVDRQALLSLFIPIQTTLILGKEGAMENMTNENEITYKINEDGLEECEIYGFLRRKKKFFDLIILTSENKIPVHRVILSRRFEHLIKVFPDSADSLVDWSRFPHELVEAVVSFAYTGSITINLDSVLQLLLFAYNLRSGQLIEWCNDFLASRINIENVVDIWVVANVAANGDLISSCLPAIRSHIDDLIDNSRFFAYTEPKGMAEMICEDRILSKFESSTENPESTSSPIDHLLTKWLSNSESNTSSISKDIVARFEDLISSLDLLSIPVELLGELSTKSIELNASKACMLNLVAALKAPRQLRWIFFASLEGCSTKPSRTAELLHLDNGIQCSVKAMAYICWGFAMAVWHKYLFIFGGGDEQDYLAKCCFFDVTDDTWTALPDMPEARTECSATTLMEREFVVVGGIGVNGVSKRVHLLTHKNGVWQWECLPSMLTARTRPGVAYYENRVFVAGGNFDKEFDIECLKMPQDEGILHQWTLISTLNFVPSDDVQLLVYSKKLYFHDGFGRLFQYDSKENKTASRLKRSNLNLTFMDNWKLVHTEKNTFYLSSRRKFELKQALDLETLWLLNLPLSIVLINMREEKKATIDTHKRYFSNPDAYQETILD
ncbi:hypothetical protein ACTXT7_003210 [Hymenolepis weldensis]